MASDLRGADIDALDPPAQARFWSELLGLPADGATVTLRPGTDLRFVPTTVPKTEKNRLHLDLASTSAEHQRELADRARELGATAVDVGQGAVPWIVLADPEGNEFCVLEPRGEYLGLGPVAAVVVDAIDPPAQARFWSQTTGLPMTREHQIYASVRQQGAFYLEFIKVPTGKTAPNRIRLRLASPAAERDPEGNEISG